MGHSMGGDLAATGAPQGAGMGGMIIPAAIGAGASIVNGLTGKHSANKAAETQQAANQQAYQLQERQLRDQEAQQNYANQQAQARRAYNMTLGNALLRSMGATGLRDPQYDPGTFSLAPPMLGGPGAPRPMTLGGPMRPAQPGALSPADYMAPQVQIPPTAPGTYRPGTLGSMFGRPAQGGPVEY